MQDIAVRSKFLRGLGGDKGAWFPEKKNRRRGFGKVSLQELG